MDKVTSAAFTVIQPNVAPAYLRLSEPVITVGRANDCTIPIKDRFLSRHHAEIRLQEGAWFLRDCGSANGTSINGQKVQGDVPLRAGDRIAFGDSEIIFESPTRRDEMVAVESSSHETKLSMLFHKAVSDEQVARKQPERLMILNALALELIEDRPMQELFDFILARVMGLLNPSRAALALLGEDKKTFLSMKVKRRESNDSNQLAISRTLLAEVVDERRVISFIAGDDSDQRLARAESILGQSIRSAICAPLLVGDSVVGVLYADFLLTQPKIEEEDLRFFAQIARFAAIKLETTRLREESVAKQIMDEELRTAYLIQSKLLPAAPPEIPGYRFAGVNRPCKTVSGDYFDFVVRPDGRVYFVIADVSGKGITAALVMASVATGFNIFARSDPKPSEMLRELNLTLAPKLSPTKFVTTLVGVLDPKTGVVEYANAGHTPPLFRNGGKVIELKETDLVVGLFAHASYRDHRIELEPGDWVIAFTDGVIEAENEEEVQFGSARALELATSIDAATEPVSLIRHVEEAILSHAGTVPLGDDVTIVALLRSA
jgi:serine phosphatase RsbU (regulator of sigma subunit)